MIDEDNQYAASPLRSLAPRDDPVHGLFTRAAKEGQHTDRLRALLTQGADIDWKDLDGLGALYYAACRGNEENAKFLLESGADVNSFHAQLGTPVCAAALKGHTLVVDLLLKHKANLDESYGGALGSVMHAACYGGSIPTVKAILEGGGSLNQSSLVSMVAFVTVKGQNANTSALKSLAREPRHEANLVVCTPILLAADQHHFQMLQSCWSGLLAEEFGLRDAGGCSPNDTWDLVNGILEKYLRFNHPAQASDSAQSGSGPSYTAQASTSSDWSFMGFPRAPPTSSSRTLLMWAASLLDLSLIDHLLKAGADAAKKDKFGRTALHFAVRPHLHAKFDDAKECIRRLAVCGFAHTGVDMKDLSANEMLCETPLMLAVESPHPTVDPRVSRVWGPDLQETFVAQLLSSGSNVNGKDREGKTALMTAVSSGYRFCEPKIVKLLCEAGAATNEVNTFGWTALHLAIRGFGPLDVISVLLNHGADPNVLTHLANGTFVPSPLYEAVDYGVPIDILQALLSYGADPNIENGTEGTAMALAQRKHRLDYVRLFETSLQNPPEASTPEASPTPSNRSWLKRLPRLGLFNKVT